MVRNLWIPALLMAGGTNAQLINGSFEDDGTPSLSNWEWTCADPGQPNDAAPSSGAWSATKEAGHAKGCFPSYLYQRLPWVPNGAIVMLSGWVRCDSADICLGAFLGLGTLNNGAFALEENTGTVDPTWTYVSLTDTAQFGSGDTLVLVLNAGMIGGPISPSSGHFDGLQVGIWMGIDEQTAWELHQHFDAGVLSLATGGPWIGSLDLFDATGRAMSVHLLRRERARADVDVSALRTGVYLVKVRTDRGDRVVRFVKR